MKKLILLLPMAGFLQAGAQVSYPKTTKQVVTEDYHGTKVDDPYRWLEDDNADATKAWVKEENAVTNGYLSTIPFREDVRKRLEELWNYPKYSSPFKKGDHYYFFKNDGLQNQAILYRQKGLDGEPEVFLDPNTLSETGIAALGGLGFNKSGKYLAYSIAMAGSDWQEVYVMNTETKQLLADTVKYVKFSGFSWIKDDGFYYSGYDKPDEKSRLSKQNQFHKIFYHKIGTPQSQDQLIYQDRDHPLRYHGAQLTEDERYLVVGVSEGTSGSEIWYRDLQDPSQQAFTLLVPGFKTEASVIDNVGEKFLMQTNDGSPNYKVVLIDPKSPAKENWKTIIPEKKEALQGVSTGGGMLFAQYLKDASTQVFQYNLEGKLVREIRLPGIGTASGFGGEKEDREFFYTYTSFATPSNIYRYDIASGKSELFRSTEVKINTADFVTEQVFFKSKDGTKVPMFLTHKKGIRLDGSNPLLLYGYGGFNVPVTPGFSVSNAFFIEQGGIYVVVNLRGGSEYGEEWHRQGMLDKKQNVFDDFIGAAEYLIAKKYTSPGKLAIRGGSNGGLLVGAAMTQRPELFRVALPAVGVMDMLRYHKFTVGWGWSTEYGNADSAAQFPYLYKYSPYHNLKKGVKYPATMVTTADHDDRVVPAHSFKFAARLQEYNSGNNPVLIRIDTDAGHGAGKPTSKMIDEAADTWSFVMKNLGMEFKQPPAKKAF
ncbi:MAG: S9 family peptidase [Chitinophagaceae bacterium]|nr:MAG: S9 family peptidase [Chitinophagaceae bacterium]